jgi:hypothetical protein
VHGGTRGWAELCSHGFPFFFEFLIHFLFYFLYGIQIKSKHNFIFKYFKHVHQPKTKFELRMMQTFISPVSFNILKKIIHLSHE